MDKKSKTTNENINRTDKSTINKIGRYNQLGYVMELIDKILISINDSNNSGYSN